MHSAMFALALASSASALVARDTTCCFSLTAKGGPGGTLGQLADGQNRIGQGLPAAKYCINSAGAITDGAGRGCILTPPTTQFQCDRGAAPTPGFAVTQTGQVVYNGNGAFYACPTGDHGGYNIYTKPVPNQKKCVQITLGADQCHAPAPAPPAPAKTSTTVKPAATSTTKAASTSTVKPATTSTVKPATTSTAKPATTTTTKPATTSTAKPASTTSTKAPAAPAPAPAKSSSCPASLSGAYQFPHLIVPVDSTKPNAAAGTSYNGTVTPTVSSLFNFDIPQSLAGKTCSLVFLLPQKSQLATSSYSLSGSGAVDFSMLASPATQGSTFANAPKVAKDYGVTTVAPGHNYAVATFACPAGQKVGFEMKSAQGTSLSFFEDYNAPGIGLFITSC